MRKVIQSPTKIETCNEKVLMARTFHRKERLSALSEINVTPLIDLAFALLIIFMITAPLLEQSISLELPIETPKNQGQSSEPRFQTISIDGEGTYYWNADAVTLAELSGLLENLSSQPVPPVLNIRADASLPYQKVITLIDLIQKTNLSEISLDTKADNTK